MRRVTGQDRIFHPKNNNSCNPITLLLHGSIIFSSMDDDAFEYLHDAKKTIIGRIFFSLGPTSVVYVKRSLIAQKKPPHPGTVHFLDFLILDFV